MTLFVFVIIFALLLFSICFVSTAYSKPPPKRRAPEAPLRGATTGRQPRQTTRPELHQQQPPSAQVVSQRQGLLEPASHPQAERRSVVSLPSLRQLPVYREASGQGPLCPDLIVPAETVCQLFAPVAAVRTRRGAIDMSGPDGCIVLRLLIRESAVPRPSTGLFVGLGRLQIILQLPDGDNLADCRLTGPTEFSIHSRKGDEYAVMSGGTDHNHYRLRLTSGVILNFRGNLKDCEMDVSDGNGQVLAKSDKTAPEFESDRTPKHIGLVLAPCTDVGLLVLGMICANFLSSAT